MTVLVGVVCDDGIVVGSDSSAIFGDPDLGLRTIELSMLRKTLIVANDMICAGTGQVGLGQRFADVLTKIRKTAEFSNARVLDIARTICKCAIEDFKATFAQSGRFGALVAFATDAGCHLCEFSASDFQPEIKGRDNWFVSMGSGQPITDPFLGLLRRVFFKNRLPSLQEGIFAVTWTLQHAIELNTGGINGPSQIATLSRDSQDSPFVARLLSDDEISEHIASTNAAEEHLAKYFETRDSGEPIPNPDVLN